MIGALHCECYIYGARSLKEKRAVVKSVMTRVKQKLNAAAAEMDHHDVWQRTALTIVSVNRDRVVVEQELQKAADMIDRNPELERTITELEWL
ncbi:DUF503 domain-containing protein [Salibacterium halotolerans]|uniref:YlxP-like protein n=1 Tax=Salibacterium halotolerans TaxID=1884432 RepID=A0A1I5MH65_9BACI|nr:DUF503 family protein [Salibacterium halotolerans]SFP08859.1 hypothetical protein SAMN05518683_102234 [Salibacterium halotolerans]